MASLFKKRKRRVVDMCEGPLFGQIVRFTIPVILSGVLQLLFNAADLVVVGQFCGSNSVAAVGATGSLTSLMVNFFIGLSVGVGVAVANAIGARDKERAQKAVHTAIPIALIGGGLLTVVGLIFAPTFLVWMGTPKEILPLSSLYMRIYFGGMIFTMVYNFGAAILRAAGNSSGPLKYLTVAGVINVVLNLGFVTLLHMDVAGVALATTISHAISATLVILSLMHRHDHCRLRIKQLTLDLSALKKILTVGIPAGIQSSLFAVSNVLIQSSINSFGSVVMAGNAAAGNLEGFVYTSMNSFAQTALNYTGQNVGAKRYDRVKRIFWICLACVTVMGLLLGQIVVFFGENLLSIYINDSTEAIQYGLARLAIVCQFYFICGMMDVAASSIRGMGVSVLPMIVSLLGACGFRILWIFTIFRIPEFHTTTWLYISYVISWSLTFITHFICFLAIRRKRERAIRAEEAAANEIRKEEFV